MFLIILGVLIFGGGIGYEAGKAGQRVEAVEQHKICFDQDYQGRKAGCYEVSRVPASTKKTK
jgi:hypothetical protein